VRYCRHGAVEKEGPPSDGFARYSTIKHGKPGDDAHTSSGRVQPGGYKERVNYRLMTASPRDWPKGRYLGTYCEIEKW
jgi:hypothetical protein